MNLNFEFITNLQYKVKSLNARIQAFESGDKYKTMRSDFKVRLSKKDREIRGLRSKLAAVHRHIVTMRKNWLGVFDDLEKEHTEELQKKTVK